MSSKYKMDYLAQQKLLEKQTFSEMKKAFTLPDGSLLYSGALLSRAAKKFSNELAIISGDTTVTYKELYLRSVTLSKKLQKAGIGKNDRVMLFCDNSTEFFLSYFAIWQIGAIVIPTNVFFHAKELAHVMHDAQPKALFVLKKFKEKFDALITEKLMSVLPLIFTEDDIDPAVAPGGAMADKPAGALFEKEQQDFKVVTRGEHELCLLLYTSGTTGKPKGVMLSSHNIMVNAMQGASRLLTSHDGKERFFCVLPLFHVFAQNTCMWLPFMVGSSVIVIPTIDRKLILQGLYKKPTIFFGVPALYGLLCLMKYAPLDSVKLFVSGADALPDKIRAAFALVYGRKICAGYGLTEAAPVIAVNINEGEQPTHVVGIPLPGIECEIRDEYGVLLPRGTIGVLWLKGENNMLGYYKSPEQTAAVLQDGWLNTGDLASLDRKGLLAICGRSKDLIIHKGLNIYPQEVENVLMKHPAVFKVAVVGRAEDASGQIPVAFVALKKKDKAIEKSLRVLCRNNLAAYKIPKKFICLDDLPMNPTGKVDKKLLK